jgi:hypothetical protein
MAVFMGTGGEPGLLAIFKHAWERLDFMDSTTERRLLQGCNRIAWRALTHSTPTRGWHVADGEPWSAGVSMIID